MPRTVLLRPTRTGNSVMGEYSLNNGSTYSTLGPIGGFALPGNTTGLSNTIEDNTLKVGLYTAGAPDATFAFDSLVVTPEPATLSAMVLGGMLFGRRRLAAC